MRALMLVMLGLILVEAWHAAPQVSVFEVSVFVLLTSKVSKLSTYDVALVVEGNADFFFQSVRQKRRRRCLYLWNEHHSSLLRNACIYIERIYMQNII